MSYQEDLILSIYNKGEAGLAMGGEEEGGRSPYEPYKPAPTGPFVPAPGKGKDKELAREYIYDADPGGVVTPRYFTPPELRQYFRTPSIKEIEMYHYNRFIKSLGAQAGPNTKNLPLSIGKLPHSPPIEKIVLPNGKLMDSPLRFKTDQERIKFMEDFSRGYGRYS